MRLAAVALIGLFAVVVAAPAAAGVFPYKVQRTTLDNGLRVLLVPMPSEGLVSYWTIVRTGSRDEVEPGVTGFAHFFEHMMFRGTEKYPGPVYDGIVTGMGASANAYTTDDLTAYHLSITKPDLPKVIEIEADRFQNLKYSETDFRTEAGAVYGEFRKNKTNPYYVLFETLQNTAFERHTYKHLTIGFEEDIKKMPEQFAYSRSFFERFYRPENCVLLVTGDFDPAAALAEIRKHYGPWKKGYAAPAVPEEPAQKAAKRVVVPFEGETLPILTVAFKGERLKADDVTMTAGLLIDALAFGQTSDLYRRLVLEEQLVQGLDTSFDMNRDPGLWAILASVKDPADLPTVEAAIWDTAQRLQRTPVDPARLDAVRSNYKYGFLSSLSTPNGVAQNLARFIALSGDLEVVDTLFATLDKVTPADVQRAAQLYLQPARSTVGVLHAESQPLVAPAAKEKPVLLPVAEDPNVALKVWMKVGSQDDPPGKEGLAALTAALVAEGGTQRTPYDEILKQLFPLAASYRGSVDREMTVFTGVAHRDVVGPFSTLFLEALLRPGFREDDFERLRSRAIETLEKDLRFSSDEDLGKATLYGRLFAGSRYAHLPLGTVAGLKAITLDDVRAFHAARYTRDAAVVAVGGAYAADLPARLTAEIQRLPEGSPATPAAPRPARPSGRQVVLVEKPGQSTAISFGAPIDVKRGTREYYALWIANSWLGEHRNSSGHLYSTIREARGINYGDYSYIEAFPQGGQRFHPPTGVGRRSQLFEVWLRPVPHDRALFTLRAGLRAVENLAKNGLTKEQFETSRNFLRKYSLQWATTTSERLGYAVDDRFYGIEDGHLQRFRAMMDTITLEEVNAAVRKSMQADNLVIAMVTADAAALKAALVADAPSPIDYAGVPKPPEILEEDKVIQSWPLRVKAADVTIVPVEEMFAR